MTKRIVRWVRAGGDDKRYYLEIADQPITAVVASLLYEFYYWRLGWILRRFEPLRLRLHLKRCPECREAAEAADPHETDLHYDPFVAVQDGRSFDLQRKGKKRLAFVEIDEATYRALDGSDGEPRPPSRPWFRRRRAP